MLPLKLLKKSSSCSNIIANCLKQSSKELPQASSVFQATCHEADRQVGPMNVISSYWKHRFENEGVSEPMESIEHIIAHVIGPNKEGENFKKEFDELQLQKLRILCSRRLKKVPVEYCPDEEGELKNTSKLKLGTMIFIPEPQSELLVELLLKHIERSTSKVCTVLEIGCGAGAIFLSLLRSCNSVQVVAIDTNRIACELALHNAQNLELDHRLTILHATLEENGEIEITSNLSNDREFNFKKECFDFVVSSPPCIPIDEIPEWKKEFKDTTALNGGVDGLKIIRRLIMYASKSLNDEGVLLLEVRSGQPEKIKVITENQYSSTLRFDHAYTDEPIEEKIVEITKIG